MSTSPQSMKRPFEDASDAPGLPDLPTKKGRPSSTSNASSPSNSNVPKVRACSACKKQKIRCDFEEGESTCVRCKKMKLDCVVNRSLQTILDEDVEWKHQMREDTIQLQSAVDVILSKLRLGKLSDYDRRATSPTASTTSIEHQNAIAGAHPHSYTRLPLGRIKVEHDDNNNSSMHGHGGVHGVHGGLLAVGTAEREGSQEPHDHVGSTLVSNPMGSLYEVTKFRGLRTQRAGGERYRHLSEMDGDFISRGVITQQVGEELFEIFRDSLNHYLYGIALTHDTLESVRASSCLLSAAIFTVASLYLPQHHHLYKTCYQEFLNLVSSSMFDRRHGLDDVRALCIGAFWLHDLSWKLSGHAVRIATELGIHQSFRKALSGSQEHFERARLWYLLYVCDHHFSIAYGRPPVIHDTEPMREWELFVASKQAIEGDSRVCSQVSLFVVLTRVYNCYEAEAEKEISDDNLKELAEFNKQLDQWRARWVSKLGRNIKVGDYPNQGVDLHYTFARLQVNSLSLRGASTSTINNPSAVRKDHATIAIHSAFRVLSIVLDVTDIRESLVGVPLYMTTMIAFAAVFLLKVTARWRGIGFSPYEPDQVWEQVNRVINMLKEKRVGEQHIIHHVAAGLEKMMRKWHAAVLTAELIDPRTSPTAAAGQQQQQQQQQPHHAYSPHTQMGPASSTSSVGSTPEAMYPETLGPQMYEVNGQYYPVHMGIFDFLSPQLPY
ncbi:hypothetical protein DFP73DRAFT_572231 [Morchella snyderi]|nr:hypothetical protein DFP73DRAFT_572231 [Morchella snyderi]